jgi:hypothetical protein
MFLKDFRIKAVSAMAVIVILLAGLFHPTKDAIPFEPGAVPLDKAGKQSMEMSKSPNRVLTSESKGSLPKESEFMITNTEDQYITEGQRIMSPDVKMRDGLHFEMWNKTIINNH